MSNNKSNDRQAVNQRRVQAITRAARHDLLTPKQKLAKLDARLGEGKGAARERAKLEAKL